MSVLFCCTNKNVMFAQNTNMTYFNFHAKVKHLINSGHCVSVSLFKNYHNIKPAMVFYFDNNLPMPIRDYMWKEYLPLINKHDLIINNPDKIDLNQFTSVD